MPSLARHNSSVFNDETPLSFSLTKDTADLRDCALVLMSDAVGAWFMKSIEDVDDKWKQLLTINDTDTFRALVQGEREAHHMRVDDSTFVDLRYAIS